MYHVIVVTTSPNVTVSQLTFATEATAQMVAAELLRQGLKSLLVHDNTVGEPHKIQHSK